MEHYPLFPGYVKGSGTSEAAARFIAPRAVSMRGRVLAFIAGRRENGATDDEVEEALGMRHQTASPRRLELLEKKLVEDSGERRATRSGCKAIVWVVAGER